MSKNKEFSPKQVPLHWMDICNQVKFLQGKVLTVIDASYIVNEKQAKAVKDLVNKMFSEQLTYSSQLCFPELPMQSREQVIESGVDIQKVEREAEGLRAKC